MKIYLATTIHNFMWVKISFFINNFYSDVGENYIFLINIFYSYETSELQKPEIKRMN